MYQSNAKSLLDNTAMLYKQSASSRHDVCLDQRSFKCKIGENCSNTLSIQGLNSNFKFPSILMEEFFTAILLEVCVYHVWKAMIYQVSRDQIFIIGM